MVAAVAVIAGLVTACDRSPPPTSTEALVNGTYLSEWTEEGVVTLTDGQYRAPAAPDAASEVLITFETSASGDLDVDGNEDAVVILVEESSGTGRFYRLHALLADGRDVTDVSSRLLGDRIAVEAVRIEDGVIETDLLVRRPGEPSVNDPTLPVTVRHVLTNRGLLPLGDPPGVARAAESPDDPSESLTGKTWRFVDMRMGEEPPVVADSSTDVPELAFNTELWDVDGWSGRLWGSSGCNRVLANYRATTAGGLRVSGLATTRRACEPAVMEFEQAFTLNLGTALGFEVQEDELEIRFAGGVIRLVLVGEANAPGAGEAGVGTPGAAGAESDSLGSSLDGSPPP